MASTDNDFKFFSTINAAQFTGKFTGPAELTEESTVPTAGVNNKSTRIANTEFVQNVVEDLIGTAPEVLDTLGELSSALNNDKDFAATVTTELGKKAATSDLTLEDDGNGHLTIPILTEVLK